MTQLSYKGFYTAMVFSIFIIFSTTIPKVFHNPREHIKSSSSAVDLINIVNSLRLSNGLSPYQMNPTLMLIAQNHTDYQASIGTSTHYGADGSRPFQRALSAGYLVAGDLSSGGFFSENIIAGKNFSESDAVNSWQLDAPHLNTMLSSSLQEIGAGVTVVGDIYYYTIDVGTSTSNNPIPTHEGSILPTYIPVVSKKILTTTPGLDGSIYHIVEIGETVWAIAQVYNISPDEIIQMNSLADSFIYVGNKLIIRPPFTPTPTIPTSTPTLRISQSPSPFPTIEPKNTNIVISPTLERVSKSSTQNNVVIITIISLTLISAGLLTLSGRRRINK